jgi:DNA end-binding protein Ku
VRSVWRGAIAFGLVHVPCRLYAATEDREPRFRILHRACRTPVVSERRCPACGVAVGPGDAVRAYEASPGRFVVLDEDAPAPDGPDAHVIAIQEFVRLAEVDPLHFLRGYFVGPAEGGARAYALLRDVLADSGRAAVGQVVLWGRQRLALLRVFGQCLLLETMRYADEIRDWRGVDGLAAAEVAVEGREREIAQLLVDRLTAPWDPTRYRDVRREALVEWLARRAGEASGAAPRPAPDGRDLLAALEASLEEALRAAPAAPPAAAP